MCVQRAQENLEYTKKKKSIARHFWDAQKQHGHPWWSVVKNLPASAGDMHSIPGPG